MTHTEALKLALEALENTTPTGFNMERDKQFFAAIIAIKEALAQPQQEPAAVYGYCPECGAKGVQRERRPNGNDKCINGHTYPSSKATPPQRTLVGLTDIEIEDIWFKHLNRNSQARAIEAKLKEKNNAA